MSECVCASMLKKLTAIWFFLPAGSLIVVVVNFVRITNSEHVRHNEELLGPLPSLDVPNDEFGRAARRGKVDVLGLVLKKRIAQLRRVGQTELVFLVDSSASVGSDNFYNEIKFIRKVRNKTKGTLIHNAA